MSFMFIVSLQHCKNIQYVETKNLIVKNKNKVWFVWMIFENCANTVVPATLIMFSKNLYQFCFTFLVFLKSI